MLLLTIRTDKPEAEIGLYDGNTKIAYQAWPAHRQLAETVHTKIKGLLESKNYKLDNLQGIVAYKGPGSFTGLRIGLSVANALADSLKIPIVGENKDNWISNGARKIEQGTNDQLALPEYGSPPHTTIPKH